MLPLRKIVRHSVLVFIFRINTWRSPHANNYAKISVQSCTRRQTIQLHLDNAAFLHFPSSQSNEISPYSKATMVKHKYVIFNNAQQKELKRIYSIKLAKLIVKGEKSMGTFCLLWGLWGCTKMEVGVWSPTLPRECSLGGSIGIPPATFLQGFFFLI